MSAASDFDRHRYMSLVTLRRNGAEVATPVWFAALDARLYVVSSDDSGKVKRLRHTRGVKVAPSNGRGRVQGPWHPATARLVTEPQMIDRAPAALRTKYGPQMWVAELLSRLTGRIRRRAWIEIELG